MSVNIWVQNLQAKEKRVGKKQVTSGHSQDEF